MGVVVELDWICLGEQWNISKGFYYSFACIDIWLYLSLLIILFNTVYFRVEVRAILVREKRVFVVFSGQKRRRGFEGTRRVQKVISVCV